MVDPHNVNEMSVTIFFVHAHYCYRRDLGMHETKHWKNVCHCGSEQSMQFFFTKSSKVRKHIFCPRAFRLKTKPAMPIVS